MKYILECESASSTIPGSDTWSCDPTDAMSIATNGNVASWNTKKVQEQLLSYKILERVHKLMMLAQARNLIPMVPFHQEIFHGDVFTGNSKL